MHMHCGCGHVMNLLLRTVIFAKNIEIRNVPIFTCTNCAKSEVLQNVKNDLTELIAKVKNMTGKHSFQFQEFQELVNVFFEMFSKGSRYVGIAQLEDMLNERINQLLDLYLLARTMNDTEWTEDIQKRLKQVTGFSLNHYRLNMK